MKAIVHQGGADPVVVNDRPVPRLRDEYILVKTVAIALNPTDWKAAFNPNLPKGLLMGVDYSGIVEEVGSKVTKDFKKGDRIAGFAAGGNILEPEDGSFAEWIVVKGDVQIKIPDNISFEEAATLGCGIGTVGQGLYEKDYGLELAHPSNPIQTPEPVLIYGGSSASGTLAIQFLKLSGYTVITTCSPRNFDLVKSLGADAVFDYNEPDVGKKINEYTQNKLKYVWDCIGVDKSPEICADALTSEPGARYGTILFPSFPRKDVKYTATLLYRGLGEKVERGRVFEASPEHFEFQRQWSNEVAHLLAGGKFKVHPVSLRKDGLKGAIDGMKEMKAGKLSGQKLVYRVAETP